MSGFSGLKENILSALGHIQYIISLSLLIAVLACKLFFIWLVGRVQSVAEQAEKTEIFLFRDPEQDP